MVIKAKYTHTNLIAKDWERLATFYENVFGCIRIFPRRDLSGKWIDDATSLSNVNIKGIHLRLPGYGDTGPTLEIFQYNEKAEWKKAEINQYGFAHISFGVENVEQAVEILRREGGSLVGKIITTEISGTGIITFVYARDPEGNIIELQKWNK
jgi:predicted enzyme related to lactoylglutathione lyase